MYSGSVLPALGMLTLAYLGCDPALFIVMLCLTTGFDGFRGSGLGVNLIDISPNYAGATMGVVNTASNVMGFVAPYIVGLLLSAGVSYDYISKGVNLIDIYKYLAQKKLPMAEVTQFFVSRRMNSNGESYFS